MKESRRYLKGIQIKDFRNIGRADLVFSPQTNVIYGDNGNGKTNLLEAVWLMTGGKSFRGAKDREMIKFGCDFFRLEGLVLDNMDDEDEKISLVCHNKDQRFSSRMAKLGNSRQYITPTGITGRFYRVIFSPTHLEIVGGGPAVRRKFMDACLCQLYPSFIENYRNYNRALSQRNAFLKTRREVSEREREEIFAVYDRALARFGGAMYKSRREFMDYLSEYGTSYYNSISGGREKIFFDYKPTGKSEEEIFSKISSSHDRDLAMGFTTQGLHREDIVININDVSAREYASQGQQRSAVVAMKLAECEIMQAITGTAPAILLDDVLSELDYRRQDYLLNNIQGRQTFITSCHLERINLSDSAKFLVENGQIK